MDFHFTIAQIASTWALLGFIQAILVTRWINETTAPVLAVVLFTVAAPLVTLILVIGSLSRFVRFLVTVGK